MSKKEITKLGVSILLVYGIIKILEFNGIGIDIYGSYIAFYSFMLTSTFILSTNYVSLKPTLK